MRRATPDHVVDEPPPAEASGVWTVAGAVCSGDFECRECGYGVSAFRSLPACPMCGGTSWIALAPRLSRQSVAGRPAAAVTAS